MFLHSSSPSSSTKSTLLKFGLKVAVPASVLASATVCAAPAATASGPASKQRLIMVGSGPKGGCGERLYCVCKTPDDHSK